MLLRRGLIADPGHQHVAEILKAADRSTSLASHLLAFSRKQILRPQVVKIDELIRGMDKSLLRVIGEDIELTIAPDSGNGCVLVAPGQL